MSTEPLAVEIAEYTVTVVKNPFGPFWHARRHVTAQSAEYWTSVGDGRTADEAMEAGIASTKADAARSAKAREADAREIAEMADEAAFAATTGGNAATRAAYASGRSHGVRGQVWDD